MLCMVSPTAEKGAGGGVRTLVFSTFENEGACGATDRGAHIIRCWGTFTKGICLVLHPILALTADQVLKFTEGSDKYENIKSHNMDDAFLILRRKIIVKMQRMKRSTTITVFLFCLPQFMVKDATFLWAVIQCAQTGTLQNIVADEAHLFAIHGASFRVEIRILGTVVYKPVFSARYHPVFIALRATMSEHNL